MKKEINYENRQIPDKVFFKILFLAPSITLMIFSLLLLIPDETEPDPFVVSVMYIILFDIFCVGIWFIISLIIYKITIKKICKMKTSQRSKTNIQEAKTNKDIVINAETNIQNKSDKNIICSCKSNLTGEEQKEMAPLLPFVYRNYVKRGTILTIIFTAVITIMYHNLKGSISFFIIMELFMIILYKKQMGNMCKKAFLKSLRKNPDIDTAFKINFYKDYIEMVGEHGSSKTENSKIINKVQTDNNIYLQTNDSKVITINKSGCSKKTLNYIEEKFNIKNNTKDTLYRKLVIFLSLLLIMFLVINYIASLPSYDNYYDIERYVNSNYSELEKVAKDYMNNKKSKTPKHVAYIYVYSPKESYIESNNTIVEFNTSAKGLVPSSIYYGFYYSEKNIPACFQNGKCNLVEKGKNKWEWYDGGDNGGTTIKIRDHWFYMEAHF